MDQAGAKDSIDTLYDLYVRLDDGVTFDEVKQRALNIVQMEASKVDALINALQAKCRVCIGTGVDEKRADAAWQKMTRIGLVMEAEVSLALKGVSFNCPACKQPVELSEKRQCPNCGVFVDKHEESQPTITPEKKWETTGSSMATMGRGDKDKKSGEAEAYTKQAATSGAYSEIPDDKTVAVFLLMATVLFGALMNDTIWDGLPQPLYYFFYNVLPYIKLAAQGLAIFAAYRLNQGRVALWTSLLLVIIVLIENALPLIVYLTPAATKVSLIWRDSVFVPSLTVASLLAGLSLFMLSKSKSFSGYSPSDIQDIGIKTGSLSAFILKTGFRVSFMLAFCFLIFVTGLRVSKDISHLDEFGSTLSGKERQRAIDRMAR
jgi:hypothetical protein